MKWFSNTSSPYFSDFSRKNKICKENSTKRNSLKCGRKCRTPHLKLDFLYRSQISWTNYKQIPLNYCNNSTFFPTNVFGSTFGEIIGILLPLTIVNTLPARFFISTWFQISVSSSKAHPFILATLALDLLYYFFTLLLLRGFLGKRRPETKRKSEDDCSL